MFVNLATDPAFRLSELTDSINILPNKYGRLGEAAGGLNLFPFKGVRLRSVSIEEQNGVLNLIQSQPVGAPGQANKTGKRKVRTFTIPHFPLDDIVLPEDVDGVRAFGQQDVLKTIQGEVLDRLQGMKNKHDITLEHLRMGALKGIILDADATEIYNLYTEFGIVQKSVDFVLGTAGTEVSEKIRELVRHIENNLKGEVTTSIRCLVSAEFWDKFIKHATIKDIYKNYEASQRILGGDVRKGFTVNGVTFEEYSGTATDAAGNARRFIASGEGHAFPEGTMDTFRTLGSPADFNETVNTIGLQYYAKFDQRKHGRGYDLHTQSNVLALCKRPAVLVRVHSSN